MGVTVSWLALDIGDSVDLDRSVGFVLDVEQ